MILLFLHFLWAAPYPATSSSVLTSDNSYFYSDWGFEIEKNNLGWLRLVPEQKDPYFLATYRPLLSAPDARAILNIRVDPIKDREEKSAPISLTSYINHWTKQFPKFGMDVMKVQYTVKNGKNTAVVDSVNQSTKIQSRQYVFWQDSFVAIFACTDRATEFSASIYPCEKIIESLRWIH
jgi:hypothetical protein